MVELVEGPKLSAWTLASSISEAGPTTSAMAGQLKLTKRASAVRCQAITSHQPRLSPVAGESLKNARERQQNKNQHPADLSAAPPALLLIAM